VLWPFSSYGTGWLRRELSPIPAQVTDFELLAEARNAANESNGVPKELR
jgi:hypothetical protein